MIELNKGTRTSEFILTLTGEIMIFVLLVLIGIGRIPVGIFAASVPLAISLAGGLYAIARSNTKVAALRADAEKYTATIYTQPTKTDC